MTPRNEKSRRGFPGRLQTNKWNVRSLAAPPIRIRDAAVSGKRFRARRQMHHRPARGARNAAEIAAKQGSATDRADLLSLAGLYADELHDVFQGELEHVGRQDHFSTIF